MMLYTSSYIQASQEYELIETHCYEMLSLLNEYCSQMIELGEEDIAEGYERAIRSFKFYDV